MFSYDFSLQAFPCHYPLTSASVIHLAYETMFVRKKRYCKECGTRHGLLIAPKPGEAETHTVRKVYFLDDIPLYETITGYINVNALFLTRHFPEHQKTFGAFLRALEYWKIEEKLVEYYDYPTTILTGTQRLETFRKDLDGYSSLFSCEVLANNVHIIWMHPYIAEHYRRFLSRSHPDSLDSKLLEIYLSRQTRLEFDHFCVDIGYDPKNIVVTMAYVGSLPHSQENEQASNRGHVYLVQRGEDRIYKIGSSREPGQRLISLQTGSPDPLRLVASWVVDEPLTIEKSLHRIFASARRQGEWFALSPTQESHLMAYMKKQTSIRKERRTSHEGPDTGNEALYRR